MLRRIESSAARKLSASPNYDSPSGKRSQLIVVHDVEAPLAQSYCDSLAGPDWFGGNPNCDTSAHYICGPNYAIQMVAEEDRAWHCGPAGNILSIGIEQTGRAEFSRADWLTADGRTQIGVLAMLMSDISMRHGGPGDPQRASNAQIQAYANGASLPGGVMWCTHHQITESLGGTTHTDPDPNYPYDVLQSALNALVVHEAPNPVPIEEDDMPLNDDDLAKIGSLIDSKVTAAIRGITANVTNYAVTPPEPRPGRPLVQIIADTHNYASAAAGRSAPSAATIAAIVKANSPADTSDATAEQIANAVVNEIAKKIAA